MSIKQEQTIRQEQASWFVVHSQAGHENKVAATLQQRVEAVGLEDQIFQILVPTRDKITISGGQKRTVKERLFPGYILVKMILNDNTWQAVRSTSGVTGFVGIGNKPTPLGEDEVKRILTITKAAAPKFEVKFNVGDSIKITGGPFVDFIGKVDEIDEESGKVKALVSIFGRETPVELELEQVTPL